MNSISKGIVLLLLIVSQQSFSQQWQEIDSIKKEINKLFAKTDKNNLQNLVPYVINNKTGFIDAKTKKIIVKPTAKISDATLFNPKFHGTYDGKYSFEIDPWGFTLTVNPEDENQNLFAEMPSEQVKIQVLTSKDGYKGFQVNEDGNLVAYSDLYNAQSNYRFNVIPFKYNGNYYAIATKKTGPDEYYSGIIDTAGNALPLFNFVHHGINRVELPSRSGELWFVVDAIRDFKGSLMNMKGDVLLKNELADYPHFGLFGYSWNSSLNNIYTGVLDFENLKWIVKPQTKIKIGELSYSSKERLDETAVANRKKARMYYKVIEKDRSYFVDFNGVKYLPVK